MTKLKNTYCDKTQKLKLWQNFRKKSNCDKTWTLKLGQNSKPWIVTKLKKLKHLKNSNCDKTKKINCDKTWTNQLCQNSKTQILTKPENWNSDKTKKKSSWDTNQKLKLWLNRDSSSNDSSNSDSSNSQILEKTANHVTRHIF